MPYFDSFPKINYDIYQDGETELATNILKRFKPLQNILTKAVIYYQYVINDGETPPIVSYKFYNSVEYDWVILMFNKMYDPYFDWPMTYDEFNRFIVNKYGSIPASQSQILFYKKILQPRTQFYDGTIVEERSLYVDLTTFNTIPFDERAIVYAYDWEVEQNEARRQILVPKETYIPQLRQEKQNIFG